jgi:hypothetical protein
MKWLKIMILAALGLAGFAALEARADIYSWTDENGVRYFTNYAPPKQAKILMKTPEIAYDEEADLQRRENDRLEAARQELAEREAFLLQQQQEAERRIAEANARAEAALRDADRILQDTEVAPMTITRAATLIRIITPIPVTTTPPRFTITIIITIIMGVCITKSTLTSTNQHFITALSGNSAPTAFRIHFAAGHSLTSSG